MPTYRDQILCWAVVRHVGLRTQVVQKFKVRGDAENYLGLLRRSLPVAPYEVIFDQGGWNSDE
jgi:hypothetical protein